VITATIAAEYLWAEVLVRQALAGGQLRVTEHPVLAVSAPDD